MSDRLLSPEEMRVQRAILKQNILIERGEYRPSTQMRWYIPCELCDEEIRAGLRQEACGPGEDAHEVIIKRGQAVGNPLAQQVVMLSKFNVCLLGHAHHMEAGQTSRARDLLTQRLLRLYGRVVMEAWLATVPLVTIGDFQAYVAGLEVPTYP